MHIFQATTSSGLLRPSCFGGCSTGVLTFCTLVTSSTHRPPSGQAGPLTCSNVESRCRPSNTAEGGPPIAPSAATSRRAWQPWCGIRCQLSSQNVLLLPCGPTGPSLILRRRAHGRWCSDDGCSSACRGRLLCHFPRRPDHDPHGRRHEAGAYARGDCGGEPIAAEDVGRQPQNVAE